MLTIIPASNMSSQYSNRTHTKSNTNTHLKQYNLLLAADESIASASNICSWPNQSEQSFVCLWATSVAGALRQYSETFQGGNKSWHGHNR
jgi:hypothetical protein